MLLTGATGFLGAFLLLGLLAELVIKVSDLHKPRRHGPLVGSVAEGVEA